MKKIAFLVAALPLAASAADSLVVYSARAEQLTKPIFEAYTKETGVNIRFVADKEGPLMERLKAEGSNSEADIFMTVDAGNLWQADNAGLFQPFKSATITQNIPANLRDPENAWTGLSVRARTIFFNKDKVKPEQLSSYEDLASAKWKGKLCLRTSKKVYNQSLVATLISDIGKEQTEAVVKGWVNNLAVPVFADDTKMLEAIAAGQCEVGIANSYYYGRLMKDKPTLPIGIFWANQSGKGVHVNVSGAGITKYSKNVKEATRFLEWLSSEKAQRMFADIDMEFPANPKVAPNAAVSAWGKFKPNLINVAIAGRKQAEAVMLMDRMGYK
ncbi:extracellular solute-binding protein [Leeia sp. TBRC 13508]|uniref:Extracellular solute-binding protein n=1 Tax=Leeia speluncae TaxID=2884804 RepID=A0ABS8D517_9NEIS|nr:extracellular solute-binding protein [Leeia speluncae]MCB6182703.1 extracellular solute-binding protein [Leeia speluncae]